MTDIDDYYIVKRKHLQDTNFTGKSVSLCMLYYSEINYIYMQGQVHFDANGIRDDTELRVLQYRTDYVNKSPIFRDGRMQNTLMLINVAYIVDNDNDSLVFFDGDKQRIWPSMYMMY